MRDSAIIALAVSHRFIISEAWFVTRAVHVRLSAGRVALEEFKQKLCIKCTLLDTSQIPERNTCHRFCIYIISISPVIVLSDCTNVVIYLWSIIVDYYCLL